MEEDKNKKEEQLECSLGILQMLFLILISMGFLIFSFFITLAIVHLVT